MQLTRTQIVKGSYVLPMGLVTLRPTKHFIQRLEERGTGLDCIPTVVRVSKDNIHSGKTFDGKVLDSFVIRLKYSSAKFLFLSIDVGGTLKTLWFKEIKKGS